MDRIDRRRWRWLHQRKHASLQRVHQHGLGAMQTDYEAGGGGGMTGQHGHYTSHLGSEYRGGTYDGMAVSEGFLREYYSNVSHTHLHMLFGCLSRLALSFSSV